MWVCLHIHRYINVSPKTFGRMSSLEKRMKLEKKRVMKEDFCFTIYKVTYFKNYEYVLFF